MATPFCCRSRKRRKISVCIASVEIKMELFVKLLKFAVKGILIFYLWCFWMMFFMKVMIILNEIFIGPVQQQGAMAVTPKVVSAPKIDSTVPREKNAWTRKTHWKQTRQYGPDKVKVKVQPQGAVDVSPKVVSAPKIDSTVLREKNAWTRKTHWEQTRQYGQDKVKVKENRAKDIVVKQTNKKKVETQIVSEGPHKSPTALTIYKGTLGTESEVDKTKAVSKTVLTLVAVTFKFSKVGKIQRSPMDLTRALTIRPEDMFIQTTPAFEKEALLSESIGERVSPKFTPSDLEQHGLSMNRFAPNESLIYIMSSLETTSMNSDSYLAFLKLDRKSSQKSQRPKVFPNEAEKLSNMTHGNPSSLLLSVGECADVTPWTILLLLSFIL